MGNYTLQQAQNDIASLRGVIAHLLSNMDITNLIVNGAVNVPWTTITLDSGWATDAGYAAPRYRLLASNLLQLSGRAHATAWSGGKTLNNSNPLPSACWPAFAIDFAYSDAVGSRAHVSISTAGVLTANLPSGASGTWYAEINAIIPLD